MYWYAWKAVQIHMYVIMYEITVIIGKLILFETRNQGAIGHAIDLAWMSGRERQSDRVTETNANKQYVYFQFVVAFVVFFWWVFCGNALRVRFVDAK